MINDMHLTGGSIEVQTYRGRAATHETENLYVRSRSARPLFEGREEAARLVEALCNYEATDEAKKRFENAKQY